MSDPEATRETSIVYERRSVRVAAYLVLKRALYRALKLLGLFALARRLTGGSLRIVCYHGFSLADEDRFSPHTFIRRATFERRLRYLADARFPVLGLGEALDRLDRGELPPCAVALTIDDGFFGTYRIAREALARRGFAATVYVTTYHVAKGSPVFGVAAQYVLWKTTERALDGPGLEGLGEPPVAIDTEEAKARVLRRFIDYGERELDDAGRSRLLDLLGRRAGVPLGEIRGSRIFGLVNEDEIREMDRAGIDIQLHTHRHRLPLDRAGTLAEIRDNRAVLGPLVSRPLEHFCYPNGRWSEEHLPWLREAGIRSAVTCDRGLNDAATPRLALRRFGDSEALSQIEFEAELCGLTEAMRIAKKAITRLAKPTARG